MAHAHPSVQQRYGVETGAYIPPHITNLQTFQKAPCSHDCFVSVRPEIVKPRDHVQRAKSTSTPTQHLEFLFIERVA